MQPFTALAFLPAVNSAEALAAATCKEEAVHPEQHQRNLEARTLYTPARTTLEREVDAAEGSLKSAPAIRPEGMLQEPYVS